MHNSGTLLKNTLNRRIGKDIVALLSHHANKDIHLSDELVTLVFDNDCQISSNAAWILTHCSKSTLYELEKRQQDFISRCLSTDNATLHRLLLTILSKQHPPKILPVPFFNRCLDGIQNPSTAPGTQALYIKLADRWSKNEKELHKEFCALIAYMDKSLCSPAVLSAIRQINSSAASSE